MCALADAAAVSCTCRRLAKLSRAHAAALCAPLALALSDARRATHASAEAQDECAPCAAARDAVCAVLGAQWRVALLRGPCRKADGAWCNHGLCASDHRARARPGLSTLFDDACAPAAAGSDASVAAALRASATLLEVLGAPRLALARWQRLAQPPHCCPRALLRVALHFHGGIRGVRALAAGSLAPRSGLGCAHAAVSSFGRVLASADARDDEAALAGTYLGFMHLDGLGVPQCDAAAWRAFSAAAQRGSADAAEMLCELELSRGWPPSTRASGSAPSPL
jgi:hypothetical protein